MKRRSRKEYLFTWATKSFYSRDKNGKVRRLKTTPKEHIKIVRNAGTWTKV